MTCARVPGKVILTGEHAVVYGVASLALALDHHAVAKITPASRPGLCLTLSDLGCQKYYSLSELQQLLSDISDRYQAWQSQRLSLSEVLQQHEYLHAWALASWLFSQPKANQHLAINLRISANLCAGMGTSAATVAAALLALSHHQGQPLKHPQLIEQVTASEQLQHGRSSGLDPSACILGGMIHFIDGKVTATSLPKSDCWLLIDTGHPLCSTGACVEAVANLKLPSSAWLPWHDLTATWQIVLANQAVAEYVHLLRHNHRLLQSLGVVPQKVAGLINQLELDGGGAKICGAGAIAGDTAGLVLACSGLKPVEPLVQRARAWGYRCWPLVPAAKGASVVAM